MWNSPIGLGLLSFFSGVAILILKFVAYDMTGLISLKSDAIESIVNVVASGLVVYTVRMASKKPDRGHPYGHGKAENFSVGFEGAVMAVGATWIVIEAVRTWFQGPRVPELGLGMALNFIAGGLNGLLGAFLITRGKALGSQAIIADGKHVLSDFATTVGLGAGMLLGHFFSLPWVDPLFALLIGINLGLSGMKLVFNSLNSLMDAEDPALIAQLSSSMQKLRPPQLITAHGLRTLRYGHYTHIDVHFVVPEFLEVHTAHDSINHFCQGVLADVGLNGEFHSHIDPCERAFCPHCAYPNCPIRQQPFEKEIELRPSIIAEPHD